MDRSCLFLTDECNIAAFIINDLSMHIILYLKSNVTFNIYNRICSDNMFTSVRAGQPVAHMRSNRSNSKLQWFKDLINFWWTKIESLLFFFIREGFTLQSGRKDHHNFRFMPTFNWMGRVLSLHPFLSASLPSY